MMYTYRLVFFVGLVLSLGNSFSQGKTIIIINPTSIARSDELVILERKFLQQKLGKISATNFIILKEGTQPKVIQFDDIDGDGKWDEAVFQRSFKPKEKAVFNVMISAKPITIKAVVRSHVRQMHKNEDQTFGAAVLIDTMPYNNPATDFSKQKLPPYLTEGPAWENDKVGFRKYFDVRNANDLWGKTTDKMVLDFVGANPDSIYHHLSWWGMDILKVGSSLGAGALALQTKWKGRNDTLIRLGKNAQVIYKQLADGPIRSIFTVTYKNWQIGGGFKPIDVTEQISIWGGQYFYENKVAIKNAPIGAKLVTGIPDFYNATMVPIQDSDFAAIITMGKQSENTDSLSMSIIIKGDAQIEMANNISSDIKNAFLVAKKITAIPIIYRYYANWQLSNPMFANKPYYKNYLRNEVRTFLQPLLLQ